MATKSGSRHSSFKFFADRESGHWRETRSSEYMGKIFNCSQNLYRRDLYSHFGCVNAIEFCNDGEWLVSGGDDKRVVLWNVEKAIQGTGKPSVMNAEHNSNIFCLGFDNDNTKIFSAGNDEQVIVHDAHTGATIDVFLHEEAVYGLSIDPLNSNVFASACDDGRILIWDIREANSSDNYFNDPFCLASYSSAFHAVMYNPMESRLLACANAREGMSLWDIRNPKSWLIKYIDDNPLQSCMSVRFNSVGTQILALRRRLPPALYDIQSPNYIYQFDHPCYYNICTMKSCCFAGENDQYVLSGSDDFNLYVWEVPKDGSNKTLVNDAHMVLKGHRSIVNQVRFNSHNFLLASSGVEKIIKLWSPFELPKSSGGLNKDSLTADKERKIFTHEEYINLVIRSGQVMTHDYSHQSTEEDPRMMAFFDSLVQREIQGLNTDSNQSGINSDSWIYNVVEGFSDSSSNPSSDSESVTVVSDDHVSEVSGVRIQSILGDVGIDSVDTRFSLEHLNCRNSWQSNSDSSSSSTSLLGSSERFPSWSSISMKSSSGSGPTSFDSITSSSSESEQNMIHRKKISSYLERRKRLKKRQIHSRRQSEDSDFDSDSENISSSRCKKRPHLTSTGANEKNDSAPLATTSNDRLSDNGTSSRESNAADVSGKCTVICVAMQNSKDDLLSNEDEDGDDAEATTPDSGIASRSFDNEKPSPSTSIYDSSELDPVQRNKNTFKSRRGRIYRSRASCRKALLDSD